MLTEMTKIKDKVKYLLTAYPNLRDNDNRLIALIWHDEFEKMNQPNSSFGFLKTFAAGKLTSPESIRRMRQKLQENHPELRGEVYLKRKAESKNIKENINTGAFS
jgi:hypothetical protein